MGLFHSHNNAFSLYNASGLSALNLFVKLY